MEITSKITKVSFKCRQVDGDILELTKQEGGNFLITNRLEGYTYAIELNRGDLIDLAKFINDKLDSMRAVEND